VSTLPEPADLHATKVASPTLYIGLQVILPALLSIGRDFAIKTTARLEARFLLTNMSSLFAACR
jgi:hypothetical protein